jgi:hypothetical protein
MQAKKNNRCRKDALNNLTSPFAGGIFFQTYA